MSVHGSLRSISQLNLNFSLNLRPIRCVEWGGPVVITEWIFSFFRISSPVLIANEFQPFLASGMKKFPLIKAIIFDKNPLFEISPWGKGFSDFVLNF